MGFDLHTIGYVSKAHGIEGGMRTTLQHASFNFEPSSGYVFLYIAGKPVPFKVLDWSVAHNEEAVIHLQGIQNIDQAKEFVSCVMAFDQKDMQELTQALEDVNELLLLKGYALKSADLEEMCTIEAVEEWPQQILILFMYHGKEVLLPLNEETLIAVEHDQQEIEVAIPEGLLEI